MVHTETPILFLKSMHKVTDGKDLSFNDTLNDKKAQTLLAA
jgi:hypothetical protein